MDDTIQMVGLIFTAIIIILLLVIICFLSSIEQKSKYNYDVDNDGKVDSRDYVLIKNYIMSESE